MTLRKLNHSTEKTFPLVEAGRAVSIYVDDGEYEVVKIAAGDLAADIERVSSVKASVCRSRAGAEAALWAGTIGRSAWIDELDQAGKIDLNGIRGGWETCLIQIVDNPGEGCKQALVVIGSDRRATAYGLYEISQTIGVSPWHWWADVSPQQAEELHIEAPRFQLGPPSVKYRGIFINDETWGIREWAEHTFAPEEGRGLGPKTYARIYELLLRLKANYLWPAMHRGTIPFNCYEENKVVADRYAIVMGSSHCEPMLRNSMDGAEWGRECKGEYDYFTNRDEVYNYFERGIQRNGQYENIYTLGMRGKGDFASDNHGMSEEEQIAFLEGIIEDQRGILKKHVSDDVESVPQVLVAYTEILEFCKKGLKLPEDITLCWVDDNFHFIRNLPDSEEQKRTGGHGMYYHLQWLNGQTTAYVWLNSTPPALMWEELNKAYEHNVREIWILNVGDIKPYEIGTNFFLDMAWDIDAWNETNASSYPCEWVSRNFGKEVGEASDQLLKRYFHLNFSMRPELISQGNNKDFMHYRWFSHVNHNDEASLRLEAYQAIGAEAQTIYESLPENLQAAYFQTVLYAIQASRLVNEKFIYATMNEYFAFHNGAIAKDYAELSRRAQAELEALTEVYNKKQPIVGAKWDKMMRWKQGYEDVAEVQYAMPRLCDAEGLLRLGRLKVLLEGGSERYLPELSVYRDGRRFFDLCNMNINPEEKYHLSSEQEWVQLSHTEGHFDRYLRVWVSVDWEKAPKGKSLGFINLNGIEPAVILPIDNPEAPAKADVIGFIESEGCVCIEAEHFERSIGGRDTHWVGVPDLGRMSGAVCVKPTHVASLVETDDILRHSPRLEYPFTLTSGNPVYCEVHCLPTFPTNKSEGQRIAISIDDQDPEILCHGVKGYATGTSHKDSGEYLKGGMHGNVIENSRILSKLLGSIGKGKHTLKLWMVDSGVIIDRIILYTEAPKQSYFGPPESYFRY